MGDNKSVVDQAENFIVIVGELRSYEWDAKITGALSADFTSVNVEIPLQRERPVVDNSDVGVAIAPNQATDSKSRDNAAKVKVEIDLLKSRLDKIWLGFHQLDGFEYGHQESRCGNKSTDDRIKAQKEEENKKQKEAGHGKGIVDNNRASQNTQVQTSDQEAAQDNYLKLIRGTALEKNQDAGTDFHLKPGEQTNISEGEYNSSSDEDYVNQEESLDASGKY
ncbi:hypothetical protein CQW23_32751 [Capsicum baccatum]|uniref:Uncharacterized protein n=1 Tax=Capsicum baccatum TaxID=33114 RepID=A0A2G2V3S8_CAPBA|nr:hypothetical protein CQW23_32751 [Capsicum baccatum]